MQALLPSGWKRPKGYSNAVIAEGKVIFTAGIVGWDENEQFNSDSFTDQTRQILINTLALLAEAGAEPEHIVHMTWYVTDIEEYRESLRSLGAVWRECMGAHYPAIACVETPHLVEPRAKLEIVSTAVLPQP